MAYEIQNRAKAQDVGLVDEPERLTLRCDQPDVLADHGWLLRTVPGKIKHAIEGLQLNGNLGEIRVQLRPADPLQKDEVGVTALTGQRRVDQECP